MSEMIHGSDRIKTVQPIRSAKTINEFKKLLRDKDYKYYIMFLIGINTGLRISDIIKLKVRDIRDKTHVAIKEQKTGKPKRFFVNEQLRVELNEYMSTLQDDDYIIPSKKGNRGYVGRIQAYRVLNEMAKQLGLSEIGTHTMRKTFGYWHYKQNKDVAILQDIFNHSSPSITMRYIGINDDVKDESLKKFYL